MGEKLQHGIVFLLYIINMYKHVHILSVSFDREFLDKNETEKTILR